MRPLPARLCEFAEEPSLPQPPLSFPSLPQDSREDRARHGLLTFLADLLEPPAQATSFPPGNLRIEQTVSSPGEALLPRPCPSSSASPALPLPSQTCPEAHPRACTQNPSAPVWVCPVFPIRLARTVFSY